MTDRKLVEKEIQRLKNLEKELADKFSVYGEEFMHIRARVDEMEELFNVLSSVRKIIDFRQQQLRVIGAKEKTV